MSDINISIPNGGSKRLLTGGKYCPEDIVVTSDEEIVFVNCISILNNHVFGYTNGFIPGVRTENIGKVEARIKLEKEKHLWYSTINDLKLNAEHPVIIGTVGVGFTSYNVIQDEIVDGITNFTAEMSGGSGLVRIGCWEDVNFSKKTIIYALKLYDINGNILYDFVPAIKGGVAGLYDSVGHKFYANYKSWATNAIVAGEVA